jgi:glutamyl-tRNA reductase
VTGESPWVLAVTAAEAEADQRVHIREQLSGCEGMLVATCHRVELYGFGACPLPLPGSPRSLLCELERQEHEIPIRLQGEAAVERLFRIAAGLESAVVGEDEVLHQVRQAVAKAHAAGPVDPRLTRLGEDAIATGRRVRSGHLPPKTGLADRAIDWLGQRSSGSQGPLLVVGSGSMGKALARAAAATGRKAVTASRDRRRAELDLHMAAALAPDAAGIAVALAGPWRDLSTKAAEPGSNLPPIVDLSFPPALSAEARRQLGDQFLSIDQLFQRAPVESTWLERAERQVAEAVAAYQAWLNGRDSVDVLRALQDRSEARRRQRWERLLRALPGLDDEQRTALERASQLLVKDLLHEPLVALRTDPDGSRQDAARRLFGL